jgi:hypothetical protein
VPVVLFLLLGVVALALGRQPSSAGAAGPGCVVAAPAFSVVQVSVITDLAPGVPAVGIEAVGTNTASSSIFVQMVVVRIASVTKAPLAAAGTCDATDYVVGSPDMLVNDDVTPGESVELTGSTIAFNSGTSNQDACKGATVHLSYDAYQL